MLKTEWPSNFDLSSSVCAELDPIFDTSVLASSNDGRSALTSSFDASLSLPQVSQYPSSIARTPSPLLPRNNGSRSPSERLSFLPPLPAAPQAHIPLPMNKRRDTTLSDCAPKRRKTTTRTFLPVDSIRNDKAIEEALLNMSLSVSDLGSSHMRPSLPTSEDVVSMAMSEAMKMGPDEFLYDSTSPFDEERLCDEGDEACDASSPSQPHSTPDYDDTPLSVSACAALASITPATLSASSLTSSTFASLPAPPLDDTSLVVPPPPIYPNPFAISTSLSVPSSVTSTAAPAPATRRSPHGSIVILAEPGPKSFLKSSKTEKAEFEVEVRLSPGVVPAGPVRIFTTVSSCQLAKNQAQLDAKRRARFTLEFARGGISLHVHRVYCELAVEVPNGVEPVILSTELSRPFLIRTNISQFVKGEKMLVQEMVFGNGGSKHEVSWPEMHDVLLEHFRFLSGGARDLTEDDLEYLHQCLGSGATVTRTQFDTFFEWYGQILKNFTDKNFKKLWDNRVIFGFLSRPRMEAILSTAGGHSGNFIVAWTYEHRSYSSELFVMHGTSQRNKSEGAFLNDHDLRMLFRDWLAEATHLHSLVQQCEKRGMALKDKSLVIQSLLPKKALRSLHKKNL